MGVSSALGMTAAVSVFICCTPTRLSLVQMGTHQATTDHDRR